MIDNHLSQRILVLDGAMGTMIQSHGLTEADFRGTRFAGHPVDLRGNNDLLTLTQPHIINDIYEQYLKAGADIISSNTLNSNRLSQADYQLEPMVTELNREAAFMAKNLAKKYSVDTKPRFVAGSIGPTGKMASLSPDVNHPAYRAVTFDELAEVYAEQTDALMDGGVDILLCETMFDTLNVKAALFAIHRVFERRGQRLPVMLSATVTDSSGRTLSGQTLEAFLYSVMHFPLISIGINCALGAQQMRPCLEELSRKAPFYVSVHPNAGLPNQFGEYEQSPDEMAAYIKDFIEHGFANIVGGCCGTTPAHIEQFVRIAAGAKPRVVPKRSQALHLSGMEPLTVENINKKISHTSPISLARFVNIGERCNVAGSRKFARLIREGKYDEALGIARMQVETGAQIIDVNMDDAMLDAEKEMTHFLNLLTSEPEVARLPVMIDSSKWTVIEAALKCLQGKSIVNSISLKEGEDVFREKSKLIQQYGAAVVVMAFDEKGQATDYHRRIEICERSYRILTQEVGFPATDIIFDPNMLTIGTGIEEHNTFAIDFLQAVRWIKSNLPDARVSGGVSNLSFAFRGNDYLREAIHAVFLFHAIQYGLDMGIVNAGALPLYDDIPKNLTIAIEDLIFNRCSDATERLLDLATELKNNQRETQNPNVKVCNAVNATIAWREQPIEQRIKHAIIKGIDDYMDIDMEEARKHYSPTISVIDGPLMDAMNEVGELFGAGKMFLPQVVKSARVMKRAVAYLQPFIETEKTRSGNTQPKGKILLATVKGDVHDIGKNIVSVVLACNNYQIIDAGVMASCEKIIAEAKQNHVDIIGLSGLITPSLDEMIQVAGEMQRNGLTQPLMIGGATTSVAHTAVKIAPVCSNPVVHVKDASRSVSVASALLTRDMAFIEVIHEEYRQIRDRYHATAGQALPLHTLAEARANRLQIDWTAQPPVVPATTGIHVWRDFPLSEIRKYINWTYFFRVWQLKGKYPQILDHPEYGAEARKLFDDANRILDSIISSKQMIANGVFGIFPANSIDDDIVVYTNENRTQTLCTFYNLRSQTKKLDTGNSLCLSDFIASRKSGIADWICAFAATAGLGVDELATEYETSGDDYSAIIIKALADRLAEAFVELLHQVIRQKYWGFKTDGIRVAHGFPACPDHSEKKTLFDLLNASDLGMNLTETFAMTPAATVSGLIFAHPQSRYFAVSEISEEQIQDYTARKGVDAKMIKKEMPENTNNKRLTKKETNSKP